MMVQCLEEFNQDVWVGRGGVITKHRHVRGQLGVQHAYRRSICTEGMYAPKLAGITTANRPRHTNNALLPVPHPGDLGMPHLLLQLEDTVHERLSGGWAARHVDIYGYNAVTSSCD
jgi:hypothetical protein